jgi:hypothetical protein
MKVGDLVRRKNYRLPSVPRVLGVITEVNCHALTDRNGSVEFWWRVLFGNGQLGFVRDVDLEVVSAASR